MEVYPGTWLGRRVAVKYLRKAWPAIQSAEFAYRKATVDLLFELQIMSRPSLKTNQNITQLLAVCFQDPDGEVTDVNSLPAKPGLVVELAHEQFPDLQHFFDRACNPGRPARLPFETAKTFVSGIANGVTALHSHDLVHADLKPGNILVFPSSSSPCGLVTKIADFGFAGMVTFTGAGKRAPLPDGRPRGGTSEWNAPECLDDLDPWKTDRSEGRAQSLEHPQYHSARDVYSFGLLSCYIALDGMSPKQMAPDLQATKLSGNLVDVAVQQLQAHFQSDPNIDLAKSVLGPAVRIAQLTLSREPQSRIMSLHGIGDILEGREPPFEGDDEPETSNPSAQRFILNFNLFPDNAHIFKCEGLYHAYWQSPPEFRARVYESFRKLNSGIFAQYVDPGVWDCLRNPPTSSGDAVRTGEDPTLHSGPRGQNVGD
ncbi:Protein kinase domain-containing protein [Cladophialophora immunda]|nr:Protein kinase domain-containing protein [Cladophialophora immunda]